MRLHFVTFLLSRSRKCKKTLARQAFVALFGCMAGLSPGFVPVALANETTELAAKASTPVFSKPSLGSEEVGSLKKGDSIQGIEKKGLFWKVQTGSGQSGYVMITKVHQPGSTIRDLRSAMRAALKERAGSSASNPRERAKNAVMGIRGLSDGDDLSLIGQMRPNFSALEMLESIQVSTRSVQRLQSTVLREGDLRNSGSSD